jgi:signal peptidase II
MIKQSGKFRIKQVVKYILLVSVVFIGCQSDWHTKRLAVKQLKENHTVTIIQGFVEFSYTENQGMIFGLAGEKESKLKHYVLITLNCAAIFFMFFVIWRLRKLSFFIHLPFFLILSGAFGNLIDRIRFGYVIDFIHIHWGKTLDWPFLFNMADVWICVGEILLIILIIFRKKQLEEAIFHKLKPAS